MCGISLLINKSKLDAEHLVSMNQIIRHRGPDDEGYLMLQDTNVDVFAGMESAISSIKAYQLQQIDTNNMNWTVGMGHRRLSIIDLSPAGHQPMIYKQWSITYNGEVYNYLELKEELAKLGHQFVSETDTEVILHAWDEWGPKALHKFNGMFAFALLDTEKEEVTLVRDRYGIKPIYFTNQEGYFAAGSEVKQLRGLPQYKFQLNQSVAYEYLRDGSLDHRKETFEEGIYQLMPGEELTYSITTYDYTIKKWYTLNPKKFKGDFKSAKKRFKQRLSESVKLRLRADVPVGTCLSGGLDSSTIVCLMKDELDKQQGEHRIQTVTSCFKDLKYDEWEYAYHVNHFINAKPHQVFPSFDKLKTDLDKMLWHMDYPFGSTSVFSQWCVFQGAKEVNMTVMIDGQGADEQLAGYGGNDLAFYAELLGKLKIGSIYQEVRMFKKRNGHWPIGFIIGALQVHVPKIMNLLLPKKYNTLKQTPPDWLLEFNYVNNNSTTIQPRNLKEELSRQVSRKPLPSLLRYEDRNSMAFSIESRVPFMDFNVLEANLGLPARYVYKNGERKHLLRQAFKGFVPEKILKRTDKMGFVSAEEQWMREDPDGWFSQQLDQTSASLNNLVDKHKLKEAWSEFLQGNRPFSFEFWRVLCLSLWIETRIS